MHPSPPGLLLLLALLPAAQGQVQDGSQEYYEEYEDVEPQESFKVSVPDSFKSYLQDLLARGGHDDQGNNSSSTLPPLHKELQNKRRNSNHQNSFNRSTNVSKGKTLETLTKNLQNIPQTILKPRPSIVHPYGKSDLSKLLSSLGENTLSSKLSEQQGSIYPPSQTNRNKNDVNNTNTTSTIELDSKTTDKIVNTSPKAEEEFLKTSYQLTKQLENITKSILNQTNSLNAQSSKLDLPKQERTSKDGSFANSSLEKIPQNFYQIVNKSDHINETYFSGVTVPYGFGMPLVSNKTKTHNQTKFDNPTSHSLGISKKELLDESSGTLSRSKQPTVEVKDYLNSGNSQNLLQGTNEKIGSKYEESMLNAGAVAENEPRMDSSPQEPKSLRKSEKNNLVTNNESDSISTNKSILPTTNDNFNKTVIAYSNDYVLNNETKTEGHNHSSLYSGDTKDTSTVANDGNTSTKYDEFKGLSKILNSNGDSFDRDNTTFNVSLQKDQPNDHFKADNDSVLPSKAAVTNGVIASANKKSKFQDLKTNRVKTNQSEQPDHTKNVSLTTSKVPESDETINKNKLSDKLTTPLMMLGVTENPTGTSEHTKSHSNNNDSVSEETPLDVKGTINDQMNVSKSSPKLQTPLVESRLNEVFNSSSDRTGTNIGNQESASNTFQTTTTKSEIVNELLKTNSNIFKKTLAAPVNSNFDSMIIGAHGKDSKDNVNDGGRKHPIIAAISAYRKKLKDLIHEKKRKKIEDNVSNSIKTKYAAMKPKVAGYNENKLGSIDKTYNNDSYIKTNTIGATDGSQIDNGKLGISNDNANLKTNHSKTLEEPLTNVINQSMRDDLKIGVNDITGSGNNRMDTYSKQHLNSKIIHPTPNIGSKKNDEAHLNLKPQLFSWDSLKDNSTHSKKDKEATDRKILSQFPSNSLEDATTNHQNIQDKNVGSNHSNSNNKFELQDNDNPLKGNPTNEKLSNTLTTSELGLSFMSNATNDSYIGNDKFEANDPSKEANIMIQENSYIPQDTTSTHEGKMTGSKNELHTPTSADNVTTLPENQTTSLERNLFNETNSSIPNLLNNNELTWFGNNSLESKNLLSGLEKNSSREDSRSAETTSLSSEQIKVNSVKKHPIEELLESYVKITSSGKTLKKRKRKGKKMEFEKESNIITKNHTTIDKQGKAKENDSKNVKKLDNTDLKDTTQTERTMPFSPLNEIYYLKDKQNQLLTGTESNSFVSLIGEQLNENMTENTKTESENIETELSNSLSPTKNKRILDKVTDNSQKESDIEHRTLPNDILSYKQDKLKDHTTENIQLDKKYTQTSVKNQKEDEIFLPHKFDSRILSKYEETQNDTKTNQQTENDVIQPVTSSNLKSFNNYETLDSTPLIGATPSEFVQQQVSDSIPYSYNGQIQYENPIISQKESQTAHPQLSDGLSSSNKYQTEDQTSINSQTETEIVKPQVLNNSISTNSEQTQGLTSVSSHTESEIVQPSTPNSLLSFSSDQTENKTSVNIQKKSEIVHPQISNNLVYSNSEKVQDQTLIKNQTGTEILHPHVPSNLLSSNKGQTEDQTSINTQTESETFNPQISNNLFSSKKDETEDQRSIDSGLESEIAHPKVLNNSLFPNSDQTHDQTSVDSQTDIELVKPLISNSSLFSNVNEIQDQTSVNSQTETELVQPLISSSSLSSNNDQIQDQTSVNSQTEGVLVQPLISNSSLFSNINEIQDQTSVNSQTETELVQPLISNSSLSSKINQIQDQTSVNSQTEIDLVQPLIYNSSLSSYNDQIQDQTSVDSQSETEIVQPLISNSSLSSNNDQIQDQTSVNSQTEGVLVQPLISNSSLSSNINQIQDQKSVNIQTESETDQPLLSSSLLSSKSEPTKDQTSINSPIESDIIQPQVSDILLSSNSDKTQGETLVNIQKESGIVQPQIANNSVYYSLNQSPDQNSSNGKRESEIIHPQLFHTFPSTHRYQTQDETLVNSQTESEIVQPQTHNNILSSNSEQIQNHTTGDSPIKHGIVQPQPLNNILTFNGNEENQNLVNNSQTESVVVQPQTGNGMLSAKGDKTLDQSSVNIQTESSFFPPKSSNIFVDTMRDQIYDQKATTILTENDGVQKHYLTTNSPRRVNNNVGISQPLAYNAAYSYSDKTNEGETANVVTEHLNNVQPPRLNITSFNGEQYNKRRADNGHLVAGHEGNVQTLIFSTAPSNINHKRPYGVLSSLLEIEHERPDQLYSNHSSGAGERKSQMEIKNNKNKTTVQGIENIIHVLPIPYNNRYSPDSEQIKTSTLITKGLENTTESMNANQFITKIKLVTKGDRRTSNTTVNDNNTYTQPIESDPWYSSEEQDEKRGRNSMPMISVLKLPPKDGQKRRKISIEENERTLKLSNTSHFIEGEKTFDQPKKKVQNVSIVDEGRIEKPLKSSSWSSSGPNVHNKVLENSLTVTDSVDITDSVALNSTFSPNIEQRNNKTNAERKSVAVIESNGHSMTTDRPTKNSSKSVQTNSDAAGDRKVAKCAAISQEMLNNETDSTQVELTNNNSTVVKQSIIESGTIVRPTTPNSRSSDTGEQRNNTKQNIHEGLALQEVSQKALNYSDGVDLNPKSDIHQVEQSTKFNSSGNSQKVETNSLREEGGGVVVDNSSNNESKSFKQSASDLSDKIENTSVALNDRGTTHEVQLSRDLTVLRNTSQLLTMQTSVNDPNLSSDKVKKDKGKPKSIETLGKNKRLSVVEEQRLKSEPLNNTELNQESFQEKINKDNLKNIENSRNSIVPNSDKNQRNSTHPSVISNSTQNGSQKSKIHIILTPLGLMPNMTVQIGVETGGNLTRSSPIHLNTNDYIDKDGSQLLNHTENVHNISHNRKPHDLDGRLRYRSMPVPKKLPALQRSGGKSNSSAVKRTEKEIAGKKFGIKTHFDGNLHSNIINSSDSRQINFTDFKNHDLKPNTNPTQTPIVNSSLSTDANEITKKVPNRDNKEKRISYPSAERRSTNDGNLEHENGTLNVKNKEEVTNRKRISKNEEVVEINEKVRKNQIIGKSKSVTKIKTEVSLVDYE